MKLLSIFFSVGLICSPGFAQEKIKNEAKFLEVKVERVYSGTHSGSFGGDPDFSLNILALKGVRKTGNYLYREQGSEYEDKCSVTELKFPNKEKRKVTKESKTYRIPISKIKKIFSGLSNKADGTVSTHRNITRLVFQIESEGVFSDKNIGKHEIDFNLAGLERMPDKNDMASKRIECEGKAYADITYRIITKKDLEKEEIEELKKTLLFKKTLQSMSRDEIRDYTDGTSRNINKDLEDESNDQNKNESKQESK